jgi:PPP family 3-phenylpropionic acid transporter
MPLPPHRALSVFYLTSFAVLGVYLPYFNLHLAGLGFTGAQIGLLSALLPLCGVVVPTLGGLASERLGRRRGLVLLSTGLAAAAFACALGTRSFAGMALVVTAFAALRAPALPLVEATAMEIADGGGPHYGRMRVWGSLAFIVSAWIAGAVVGRSGHGMVVPLVLGALLLNVGGAWLLPPDRPAPPAAAAPPSLAGLMRRTDVLLFLLACLLSQAAHGPYYVFFSLYLEARGYDAASIGGLWGLAVLCEVAMMLWLPALLSRTGPLPILGASLLVSALRWWICARSAAPAALIAAQGLHAVTFAAFHLAAVTHTHRIFGAGRRASGQAIYGSAAYGAGNILGMLGSGLLLDRLGFQGLFAAAAWVALAGAALVIPLERRRRRARAAGAAAPGVL